MTLVPLASYAGEPQVSKILFVGDSITKHGEAADLGWKGNWGMAASSEAKDYVHLFLAKLIAAQGGKVPELLVDAKGGGTLAGKLTQLANFKSFGADLAIVQMGENDNKEVNQEGFQHPYEEILQAIKEGNSKVRILCTGVWSPPNGSSTKDTMIQEACKKAGAVFVDMSAANFNPANMAGSEKRFTHPGVNWHPGDRGQQAYADALWLGWTHPEKASQKRLETFGSATVIMEEKWDGHSGILWSPTPTLEKGSVKLVAKTTGSIGIDAVLPLDRCLGHYLIVETTVRGEKISEKPQPYNGVKLMLGLVNAEGKQDFPQAELPVGSFEGKTVRWGFRIPDNIVSAKLHLGLEMVTGTVWFDALKISITE